MVALIRKLFWVLLAAAVVAYFVLPYQTTEELEEALRSANKEELERLIDFPSVRESAKEQLKEKIDAAIAAAKTDGAGPTGQPQVPPALAAMAGPLLDQVVNAIGTPEGLINLMKLEAKVKTRTPVEIREKTWVSPLEFTGRAEDRSILRFRFFGGRGWRLVAIEMSEEMAKKGPLGH